MSPWVRKQCSVCTAGTAALTDVSKPLGIIWVVNNSDITLVRITFVQFITTIAGD